MMTLKKLKAKTGHPSGHGRIRTEKELKRASVKVVASCQLDQETRLRVYEDGTVVFQNGRRKAVFSVHDCTKHGWDFVTEESAVLEGEDYENVPWEVCLYMEGMDRIEKNLERADTRLLAAFPDDEELLQEPPCFEEGYSLKELESCLENVKENFSHRQERIFRSYFLEEKKQAEIAREAGIAQMTVSRELACIRKILSRNVSFA